ncbi:MAG: AraC family transcriptional regulator [Verrucomicrobiota bacterium]|jgi:AraC-like DNA-binding protein
MAAVGNITYKQLVNLPLVRCYERAFRQATGLALKLVPAGAPRGRLPLATRRNAPHHTVAGAPASREAAGEISESRVLLPAGETQAGQTVHGCAGLRVVAVPVVVGGLLVATWICSQGIYRQPTQAEDLREASRQLAEWGIRTVSTRLPATAAGSRVVSTDQLQAIGEMLRLFAEHVAQSLEEEADRLWVACRRGEPRWVTRAKEFVRTHIDEPILGRRLAAIVHVSPDYFARVFREATAVPFKDYVLGLRIERAKTLLADPALRIHEVAGAAGFGIASEFMAAFRESVGESPAQYRAKLHTR